MTLNGLRAKHRDVVIVLTVSEIVEKGLKCILGSTYPNSQGIGEEVRRCAEDIKEAYDNNYNDFRAIIKRCL